MIDTEALSKTYRRHGSRIEAVSEVNLEIREGEFCVLHGASGSGKSTLLLMLGGMLRPTAGRVTFAGQDVYALGHTRRNRFRRTTVGFLFQKFFLMPYLTVYDNIRLMMVLRGQREDSGQRISSLAEQLGITERLQHRPSELSVGEQQRAAMARTLAADPPLILADEPTGNLDRANTKIIAECLQAEHARGRTIVLATHDESMMMMGDRQVELHAGRVAGATRS